jgi:peptide/nickel transport system permease protein
VQGPAGAGGLRTGGAPAQTSGVWVEELSPVEAYASTGGRDDDRSGRGPERWTGARFLGRRVVFYAVTAWAAITLNFIIPRLMPGDPAESVLSRFSGPVTPQQLAAVKAQFGLSNSGILAQYGAYLRDLAHGDLGVSITYFPEKVSTVIGAALPWTVILLGVSTVIGFALGTLLGVLFGWRRGARMDWFLPAGSFFSSVPYFWVALLALTVFGADLHWFPLSGGYADNLHPGWTGAFVASALWHSLLPAFTIVICALAGWVLGMRNMMVTVLSDDYVLVAEAKGLPRRRVIFGYAARNALLPNVASFALALGFIVGGSIVVEEVFSYPGIGFLLFNAVGNSDYPLMEGIFLVITLMVLAANLLADVCYVLLDPRTRAQH